MMQVGHMTTEEESQVVRMYEEMFAHRYTEADPDYQKVVSNPIPHPPCVQGYFTRSRRNFDNNRGGRGRGRGHWNNRDNRDHGHWNRNHHQNSGGYNDRRGNGSSGSHRQFY